MLCHYIHVLDHDRHYNMIIYVKKLFVQYNRARLTHYHLYLPIQYGHQKV